MKNVIRTIAVFIVALSSSVRAETANPPIDIRIAARLWSNPPIENSAKYRVIPSIDLTNNERYPIHIIQAELGLPQNGQNNYYIIVRRQDGKPGKFWNDTDPYTNKEMKRPGVYRLVTVNPGQRMSEQADADSVYDMRQPGIYLIHVERKLPPELGGNFVSSNEITVEITN